VHVKNGEVISYGVICKVSFRLDDQKQGKKDKKKKKHKDKDGQ